MAWNGSKLWNWHRHLHTVDGEPLQTGCLVVCKDWREVACELCWWDESFGWILSQLYIYTVYRLSSSKPTCPHQKSWVDDFPAFQFGWDMWPFPGAVYLLRLDALQEQARLAQQIDVQHLGGSGRSTGYFFLGVCNFKMNLRFLVMQMTMDHYPPWN